MVVTNALGRAFALLECEVIDLVGCFKHWSAGHEFQCNCSCSRFLCYRLHMTKFKTNKKKCVHSDKRMIRVKIHHCGLFC